jgi:hypothetical protein
MLLISLRRWVDSRGHNAAGRIKSMEILNNPIGNKPATFRLVTQCLNQPHATLLKNQGGKLFGSFRKKDMM